MSPDIYDSPEDSEKTPTKTESMEQMLRRESRCGSNPRLARRMLAQMMAAKAMRGDK